VSSEDQIENLRRKHAELEATIEQEEHRPLPDTSVIHALKKQKLAIKDQIAALEHEIQAP